MNFMFIDFLFTGSKSDTIFGKYSHENILEFIYMCSWGNRLDRNRVDHYKYFIVAENRSPGLKANYCSEVKFKAGCSF